MSAKQIYFIGIAGIGMSALAQHAMHLGFEVFGYDRNANDQTALLKGRGAKITQGLTDFSLLNTLAPDSIVVRTSAAPTEHPHCQQALKLQFRLIKRAQLLAEFLIPFKTIAVAGTHGKTSTSSFLAHFLKSSDLGFSAFLGGVSSEFGTNYFNRGDDFAVVEADEYDRSLLTLSPECSVITNVEVDHLDCYADLNDLEETFLQFQQQTRSSCIVHESLSAAFSGLRYGLTDQADYRITPVESTTPFSNYQLKTPKGNYTIQSNTMGLHNALNAVAAFAAAAQFCDEAQLISAFETLPQIQRRFNVVVQEKGRLYVDDYAHHPSELTALHDFARALASGRKLTLVFQPHLFSRTLQLKSDFIAALDLFDRLIILPIYGAREQPNSAISSEQLVSELGQKAMLCSKQEVLGCLKQEELQVLITAGAGDIAELVEPIKQWMTDECLV